MTLLVTVSPAALRDLQNIYQYIADRRPPASEAFLRNVAVEFDLLSERPFLGRRRHFKTSGIRSWRVRGFENFIVYYRVRRKDVRILRVLHGAQDVSQMLS
ncbi:MAG: type II toxin-antitoxin system RelE/ParE family toxin [Myxococcaceae bacterium]